MTIVHDLYPHKCNWFENCPICGAEFEGEGSKKMLAYQDKLFAQKMYLIEDRRDIIEDYIEEVKTLSMHCSKCTFIVQYNIHFNRMRDVTEDIKEVTDARQYRIL